MTLQEKDHQRLAPDAEMPITAQLLVTEKQKKKNKLRVGPPRN